MESELAYNIKAFEETIENLTNFLITDVETKNFNIKKQNNDNKIKLPKA